MQLSGGPYSYNRFDVFEESLVENREAAYSAGESEGKKEMRSAGKPAKVTGGKLRVEMGKDGKPLFKEGKDCECDDKDKKKKVKKGSVGYVGSEKEEEEDGDGDVGGGEGGAMGEGFMPLPADKMSRQADKAYAKEVVAAHHGKSKEANKQMQRRIAMNDPKGRKVQLMKKEEVEVVEELNNDETKERVMENRMSSYSRALGVMGAHYSGQPIEEKKADKDYDEDGKVESSKEEYFGSKDKAIKKAMKKEDVSITKEDVVEYLVTEGYASNEVSAEILHQHISDEFLQSIEEEMEGLL